MTGAAWQRRGNMQQLSRCSDLLILVEDNLIQVTSNILPVEIEGEVTGINIQ